MDLDEPEPEDAHPSVHGCLPHQDSAPSPECSSSQDRGEEEIMMSNALEGLPEWRSLSRSSEWGRRSDVPSQHRSQDEQDVADAISKRTRAHYSLADMSLDQLETFLQESDEEDYFQNVDDEEEYRKFLAAVQEKVGTEEDDKKEKIIDESESEDEDADFEVEIEEALESDIEEGVDGIVRKSKRARRPVTREKRRKRESLQSKSLLTGRAKAPLRPLLPYAGNVSVAERSRFLAGSVSRSWMSSAKRHPSACGFTAHQIGQLYCLMHEHVQLLLQVYAMCILEPEMQRIAADTHKMLMELVEKREAVLSWKMSAFPDFCFRPPYTHSSVAEDEVSSFQVLLSGSPQIVRSRVDASSTRVKSSSDPDQCGVSIETIVPVEFNSTSLINDQPAPSNRSCSPCIDRNQATPSSPTSQVMPQSLHSISCEVVGSPTRVNNLHADSASALAVHSSSGQTKSMENACGGESGLCSSSTVSESSLLEWVPATSGGPVRSLLDVAPLALVREFMATVDQIVQASRQQHFPSEILTQEHSRAPLFAVRLQGSESRNVACERVKAHSPSPNLKRTMAAVLVESTKKQTIALVPTDIAAAMERFGFLFNRSLFPHKAPPASAANRLLFTDVEDELLAMGLMTYNNDWKAIQERFLPSKSMHQIFVRQKNRSSARAPQNSIKAVRRMKLSPLTADEMACIEEALKVYKYDWTKVCHYSVPHRDPSTLPRQWRVALGTQKSYKHSVSTKEMRRLHDARRHHGSAATSQICHSVRKDLLEPSESHGCGNGDGKVEKMHFHEGISGDLCTSRATSDMSSEFSSALDSVRSSATTSSRQGKVNGRRRMGSPSLYSDSLGTGSKSSNLVHPRISTSLPPHSPVSKVEQTVKLAPGLPLLKLPPTVRILSHSDTALLQIPSVHSCNAKVNPESSTNKFLSVGLAGERT